MTLPDKSKLQSIYQVGKSNPSLGLPTNDWYWSSSESKAGHAYTVCFADGDAYHGYKLSSHGFVLCVDD